MVPDETFQKKTKGILSVQPHTEFDAYPTLHHSSANTQSTRVPQTTMSSVSSPEGDGAHDNSPQDVGDSATTPSSASPHPVVEVKKPKPVFTTAGSLYEVPPDVVQAVDNFSTPEGFHRDGSRERSFMYSVGVFCKPHDTGGNVSPRYYCLANKICRSTKNFIPCAKGDRGNVNKHLKKAHKLVGQTAVKKEENATARKGSILQIMDASNNSRVGTSR